MLISKSLCKYRVALFSQNNSKYIQNFFLINRSISLFSKVKNESDNTNIVSATDDVKWTLPEPPVDLPSIPGVEVLNKLGEPTFHSLGLNNMYWPTGWMQWVYECMHVDLGLSWWSSIVLSAVVIRSVLFPLSIKIKKISSTNALLAPKLFEFQKLLHSAKVTHDQITMAKLGQKYMSIISQKQYRPIAGMFYSCLQIPVFLTVMLSLRQMAMVPVKSLETGGLFWFQDLTLCDPCYILPLSTMILFLLQIEFGADVQKNISTGYAKWAIRAVPIVGFAVTLNLPSVLLLYWWTSSLLSLGISGLMSIPAVKSSIGVIPLELGKNSSPTAKVGIIEGLRDSGNTKKTMNRAQRFSEIEHENWIKAGTMAVPKTYSYDPTKVKS